ncbi:MAG: hypothetical protein V2I54_04155 [Bacteroidales bacterium]|jgi:hypothetical protein|nr:hypothetical protein [Bacteroidales bacterium]
MFIELFFLVAGLMVIAFVAMGFNVFFRRNKKFPETSVGKNKDMRKLGLSCARHEEIRCRREIDKLAGTSGCAGCGQG